MKKGTYTKGFNFGYFFIKLSSPDSWAEKELSQLYTNKSSKEYFREINKLGIPVAKIFFEANYKNFQIIIQKKELGITLNEFLKTTTSETSLLIFKEILTYYKLISKANNLLIDWNLNNFIINKQNQIKLIDCNPPLSISIVKKYPESQLKLLYLNNNIQLCSLLGYWLQCRFHLSKKEFIDEFYQLTKELKREFKFDLEKYINNCESNHILLEKIKLIIKLKNNKIEFSKFKNQYLTFSLKKEIMKGR